MLNVDERRNMDNVEIGDIVLCTVETGHVFVDYALRVTCIDEADFEEDEDGNVFKVYFGEPVTEDDEEIVEDCGTCRIDLSNFSYILKKKNN